MYFWKIKLAIEIEKTNNLDFDKIQLHEFKKRIQLHEFKKKITTPWIPLYQTKNLLELMASQI